MNNVSLQLVWELKLSK